MELWSRGLGKVALNLDFAEYDVHYERQSEDGKVVIMSGTVHNRILWKARIVFFKEDMPGLLHFVFRLVFSGALVALILGKEKSAK